MLVARKFFYAHDKIFFIVVKFFFYKNAPNISILVYQQIQYQYISRYSIIVLLVYQQYIYQYIYNIYVISILVVYIVLYSIISSIYYISRLWQIINLLYFIFKQILLLQCQGKLKVFLIQKLLSRGILMKRYSKNMQSNFIVLLKICCIFSGHLFLRILLEGCFFKS